MSSTESASAGVIGRIVVIAASTPENAAMKVYLSVDMEGVAGIVDWQQCVAGGDDYALGRELLLGEVNAAIDGALAAGVTGAQYGGPEAAPSCPGVRHVPVKESISRYAACSLHPHEARERIRTGVHSSLSTLDKLGPPRIALPATLEVDLASPDMAE